MLEERGGAPLHFLLAWVVAHLGLGLGGLRALSALFAVASLPVVALLAARLAGRVPALVATVIVALELDVPLPRRLRPDVQPLPLHERALVPRAAARARARRPAGLGALGARDPARRSRPIRTARSCSPRRRVFVLVARRDRLREALWAFGAVGVLGIPFWLTDLVLAGRFDVGVGRRRPDQPASSTSGTRPATSRRRSRCCRPCSSRRRPASPSCPGRRALLAACAAGGAAARARRRAQLGLAGDAAPDLPPAVLRARGRRGPGAARPRVGAARARGARRGAGRLGLGPDAGAVRRGSRTSGRRRAPTRPRTSPRRPARATCCSATTRSSCRPGSGTRTSRSTVLPRADAELALHNLLELERPLGHGVWVFDASKTTNFERSLEIPRVSPRPAAAFEVRDFGPFLVIRTRAPVRDARALPAARRPGDARREAALPRRRRHQPADDRARRPRAPRLRRVALPLDELAVAGRLLEGGEPGGRLAPALLGAEPAGGCERRRRADGGADEERARSRAA